MYEPLLRRAAERSPGGGLHLVLDTTYCSPGNAFPPQAEAVRFVCDAVRAEASATGGARTLFLFGTYTIGKERVFLEARTHLAPTVHPQRTRARAGPPRPGGRRRARAPAAVESC